MYPPNLQLNKASDTEFLFLDLSLSIFIGFFPPKFIDFDIVNFPFLDGDVPCRTSYFTPF